MKFTIKTLIPASPEEVYTAWLSRDGHTKMTGGEATITAVVGESFTAWDGYIKGNNVELEPNAHIVQSWRTSDFADNDPDSQIEIVLRAVDGGTELTLTHTNLPAHGEQYRTGWDESYFQPMKAYFSL